MKNISFTRKRGEPASIPHDELHRLSLLTDEDVVRAAKADPDNPPLTQEQLHRMQVARFVRETREATGFKQSDFAERFGFSLGRLRDFEQGRSLPDTAVLVYLRLINADANGAARLYTSVSLGQLGGGAGRQPIQRVPDQDELPSIRTVHLQGGLRAFDFGEPNTVVGLTPDRPLLMFPRPPYPELYRVLDQLKLHVVGVEFITSMQDADRIAPPDWEVFSKANGFLAMQLGRLWGDVRHVPEQNVDELVDFAGRFSTYHRLLSLRIHDLSEGYLRTLNARLTTPVGAYDRDAVGGLFSNGFLIFIEAAIHAFLSDAAAFRDLIAEAIWRLVLRENSRDVTTFATLLRRTKQRHEPIVEAIQRDGSDGGWLKLLADLRNSVVHVAPLANTHEIHMAQLRFQDLGSGRVPTIHYPLTTTGGKVRARPKRILGRDNDEAKARLGEYRDFVAQSTDALAYCSQVHDRLAAFSQTVRIASGLQSKAFRLANKDIISRVGRP